MIGESGTFYGESIGAWKSDYPYDGDYSPVVVAVAAARVCF